MNRGRLILIRNYAIKEKQNSQICKFYRYWKYLYTRGLREGGMGWKWDCFGKLLQFFIERFPSSFKNLKRGQTQVLSNETSFWRFFELKKFASNFVIFKKSSMILKEIEKVRQLFNEFDCFLFNFKVFWS